MSFRHSPFIFSMSVTISRPETVVDLGERIYREQLKDLLEPKQTGRFVAIEVNSGKYFIADSPSDAMAKASSDMPQGLFHLMRIGATAAFTTSSILRHERMARTFGR